MHQKTYILLSCAFVMLCSTSTTHSQLQHNTALDLDMMYQLIIENHPGIYNTQDPKFSQNMNQAYLDAKKSLATVQTSENALNVLTTFAQSFNDQHLCVYSPTEQNPLLPILNQSNFSIHNFTDNIAWVTIPNLCPSKEEQPQLEALIEHLPALQTKKSIVFDLRGNNGGSTLWSTRILDALFDKEYVYQKCFHIHSNSYEDFRVSKSNLEYWKHLTPWFEQNFKNNSSEYQNWLALIAGMQKAYDEQKIFYSVQQQNSNKNLIDSKKTINNPCLAKIIIIIDAGCFSSCLSFIYDLEIITQNTIKIGQKTSTNTAYMEIREDILPSGIHFRYPTAIGRNSKPFLHCYVPDIEYPQNCTNQNDQQSWLEKTIRQLS